MRTPQFHTDPFSSTQRFHTRTTPFQHQNPKNKYSYFCRFYKLNWVVCRTEGSVELRRMWNWGDVELRGIWNWGLFGVELRGFWRETERVVELRDFWCGTQRFSGLKRSGPLMWNRLVELRRSVELRRTPYHSYVRIFWKFYHIEFEG